MRSNTAFSCTPGLVLAALSALQAASAASPVNQLLAIEVGYAPGESIRHKA